jgi:chromosome segregation ATPase
MTVPGKGGRPRKWRSDADRQRAWRARTTGAAEPPTMLQALDHGDELARTWQMIRDLGAQLDAAKAKAKALQVELNRTRREHATEDRRWGWITTENQHLHTETERLRSERDDALARLRDLEHQQPAAPAAPPPPAAGPGLSRAERRRLEREQRRHH